MASSLKVILFKGKTHANGSYPIMLQFINGRKIIRKTIHRCRVSDWDEKSSRVRGKVRNAAYINNLISEKYIEAEKQIFRIMTGSEQPENIFQLKGEGITLEHAIAQELIRLKSDMKAGTYNKVLGFLKELKAYTNISNLTLREMNLNWFSRLANHFSSKGNIGSTAQKKIKTIKAIVSRYSDVPIDEELKRLRFKAAKTVKQKLDADELHRLETLELPEGDISGAVRDLFLLQVYL